MSLFDGTVRDDLNLLEMTVRAVADCGRELTKSASRFNLARGRRLLQDLKERRMSLADPWKRRKMDVGEIKLADKAVFEIDDLLRDFAPKVAAATEAVRAGSGGGAVGRTVDQGGEASMLRNMFDDQARFMGKPIGDIRDGGGAAGRALVDDFKAAVAEPRAAREQVTRIVKAAEGHKVLAKLKKARAATKDPALQKEIDGVVQSLTTKFHLVDASKSGRPDVADARALERRHAELLVFEIENLTLQTSEIPLREALGYFSGRIRQQYAILDVQPPRVEPEGERQVLSRRQEAARAIAQLEAERDKTDDPVLRQELDRMATDFRRTYGITGPLPAEEVPPSGQGHTVAPLPRFIPPR